MPQWLQRLVSLALVVSSASALAQSNVAFGELHGTVTDPSDAIVSNARITLASDSTGLRRTTTTDEKGSYRFLLIPPGEYSLQIEKQGFRSETARGVTITVGQVATLSNKLELGVAQESITVEGAASLIEPERGHQENTIDQAVIENLPIDRRDYLTFGLLAPGVADSNALADNADFRIKQTPQSGLSFYGSNGRGNSVTLDGGEANDGSGGVRSTLSQEAVQEFEINRSNYSAELGGASGGVINIVSRRGTNDWHGSGFGFFRNDAFDAGDPFARVLEQGKLVRVKPPSKRQQFGAAVGGPIRKDRTFFFSSFEGLVRRESAVVSLLTDMSIFGPTPAQQAVLSQLPDSVAVPLRAAFTSPPSTIALFQQNSGVFPYSSDNWLFSTRLDHRISDRDQVFLRENFGNVDESNPNLQALIGASRGIHLTSFDPTTAAGWTHIFNPALTNELGLQFSYRRFNLVNTEQFGPELRIAGFGVFNRDYLLPSRNVERRYEIKDNLSYLHGSHLWKFGAQILIRGTFSDSQIFFGGRFTFGDLPATLLNPALPASLTINALQAFNLGLAQTFIMGSGNPVVASTYPYYGFYAQDSWKVRPGLTLDFGLRYELDTRTSPLPVDKNNFAPRFSFAWDPFGTKKTVVRGGYGIFYSPIYYQVDWAVNALNQIKGQRQVAQAFTSILTPGAASSANIFTTLLKQGVITLPAPTRALAPADVAQFGLSFPHSGPVPPFTTLFDNSPDYVNPYAQQASLSIEREFGKDLSVSVGYVYVRTLKIARSRDSNILPAPVDPKLGIPVWTTQFANPLIAQLNVFESTARAFYNGLILEVKKRFSGSFSLGGNYTLSKATDDVVDYNTDFEAFNQTNLKAEHALSSFDQRHKVVVYGIWDTPGRFQLAPIFRANSGRPFNLLAGYDLNGDRHDTTDRPAGAGPNTGIGPNFWTFDLRLSRSIHLRERASVELMAEAFNLFNRLNFGSVNNTVGNIPAPFNLEGRNDRSPSQPLGFTSAADPRRIQLGVRFKF